MPNIIVCPVASHVAFANFQESVLKGVEFSRVSPFMDPSVLSKIKRQTNGEKCFLWGLRATHIPNKVWQDIREDDDILFLTSGALRYHCKVLTKLKNIELAEVMWKKLFAHDNFENVLFLSTVREVNIPRKRYNEALSYKEGAYIQAVRILNPSQSYLIRQEFDLGGKEKS